MKKLFISIFTCVFALFALGTSTFAWFSMNAQVSASGMEVKAIAGSSLQISETTSFVSGKTSVEFDRGAYTLIPAVKFASQNGVEEEPDSHLVTVKNTEDINPATGLAKADATLVYEAAETESTNGDTPVNGYYVDYDLYLAAEGTDQPITNGTLKITVAKPADSAFAAEPTLKAVSIMVLDKDNNQLGGKIIRLNLGETSLPILTLSNEVFIPASYEGTTSQPNALKITLRIFIDGAYEEETGVKTYVRNTAVVDLTKSLSFGVVFDLVQ